MQIAIALSMKEFEEEQTKHEEEKRKEKLANNSLAQSLAKNEAKSKYSKEGFVPKALRKPSDTPKTQESVSENEYYGHDHYRGPR